MVGWNTTKSHQDGASLRCLRAVLVILSLVIGTACGEPGTTPSSSPSPPVAPAPPPADAPPEPAEPPGEPVSVRQAAVDVVAALADRDLGALAAWVDPERGVRFTPYGYVNPETDVTLRADELAAAWESAEPRLWGSYDGSGEPIELTFRDYFERFVWDADYADAAAEVAVDRRLGQGNSLDNSAVAYPEATIVEVHLPGRNPEYGGMDWRSLRLALVPDGSSWRLVGIIHDEWTI